VLALWQNQMMAYVARILRHRSNLQMCLLLGFLFWFAFLLVLQPGNVARAMMAGYALSFEREAIRIIGAGVIGAAWAPIVPWLAHR